MFILFKLPDIETDCKRKIGLSWSAIGNDEDFLWTLGLYRKLPEIYSIFGLYFLFLNMRVYNLVNKSN